MLNRRSLRVKAMQSIYAFRQAERSNYYIALDLIDDTFAPDLNAMQAPNLKQLEGNKQLAKLIFEENYQTRTIPADEEISPEVRKAVDTAIDFYHTQHKKDFSLFSKQMVADVEKIFDRYLLILLLVIELSEYVQQEEEERRNKQLKTQPVPGRELKLYHNQVVEALKKHKPLEIAAIKNGLGWNTEREFVKKLYKDALKNDPVYEAYIKLPVATFEDDKNIVIHIIKNIIFKHELAESYFQRIDLSWAEDSEVLRSMVVKTMKAIQEGDAHSVELLELAKNWDEDREFMKDLYRYTLENDEQYEDIVSNKIKNWDVERVAIIDRIMLKMAICEMLRFPSIPVKVTINEYIELSKIYSTPKSKQFINGLLDAIVADLQTKGLLKKSGRGLIDNK